MLLRVPMNAPSDIPAWLTPPGGGRVVIRGTCSIGRSPSNQLVLTDDKVSRRHAIVHTQEQNEFWLVDLGSSNGTCLNGRRVTQPVRLRDQDQIDIGHFRIVFHEPTQATAPAAHFDPDKTLHEIKSAKCWLLVADIEASTQLSRRLPDSELPMITGRWLAECKQIVEECGGSINKFLGDGFFAYWYDREKIVPNLVRALEAFKRLQAHSQPSFRVVVHYGRVSTGAGASMGEESLLGKEVNFVFRMEKLAALIGELCLLSEPAREQIAAQLPVSEAGRHALSGFEGDHLFFSF